MNKISETTAAPAYLVFRQGRRWSDVFRLSPGSPVVIGRSSRSQIAIRSDGASRSHAEINDRLGYWAVADLGSRNGTFVDGKRIENVHPLQNGQTISVAGFQLTFVRNVAEAFSSEWETADGGGREGERAGLDSPKEDSNTLEQIDPTVITDRRRTSRLLAAENREAVSSEAINTLLRSVFELARCQTPEEAAETALSALAEVTGSQSGAVLVAGKRRYDSNPSAMLSGMSALATRSRPNRSYRRIPDKIAATVLNSGEAILARNIVDDLSLASPDSRGELSSTSTLCAPLPVDGKVVGILHIYSCEDEQELHAEHLEIAIALCAHLGIALEHLWKQRQLSSNLRKSQQQIALLREQLGDRVRMIGQSEAIQRIEQQIVRAAPTHATVLVRGESGVGKELIAAAIHYASPRRDGPFICLNCAALSPSLLESELFGHEKGAFTGATERKIGKFEAADGGTLMLDEIGEMNPEIQAKFLRVLEGQPFERVGGNAPIRADVRVVAATNRNLEDAVRDGSFRSDLFFRLHVLELRVPPLRERGNDVMLIAQHFLAKFNHEIGRRLEGFTESATRKLLSYRWPGNIRELRNTIERAVVLCAGPQIDVDDIMLSDLVVPGMPQEASRAGAEAGNSVAQNLTLMTLADLEQRHIEAVLNHTGGNKSQAAKILGIERSTLDRKLKRYEDEL